MIFPYALSRLSKLTTNARIKHYPKNQIVLYSGDAITELHILKKGIVKIYDIDHQGNEKVLHILKPPCIMPLTALQETAKTTEWFYSAVTDCEIYTLARTDAEHKIEADGKLAKLIMDRFANETHEILVHLSGLSKTDVHGKLIYVLRFLAVYHTRERRGGWRRVTFPIGQQLLADMIGMTRESTAIGTKHLRDMEIIRYPRAMTLEINLKNLLSNELAIA
jgi:CRP-like cAMP-binding protein